MSAGPGSRGDGQDSGGREHNTAGMRLRAARRERKLDIEAVARELHLDSAVIEALENDNQAALPAPIFVQGYVRSYARLVGLPEEEMLRLYDAHGREPPPLSVARPILRTPRRRRAIGRQLRLVVLVILAGILVWLAYPLVERFVEGRGESGDEGVSGQLELPPVMETTQPFE